MQDIETTIAQLGGRRIFVMAFDARGTRHNENTLTLAIARSLVRGVPGKATHVHIVLGSNDTYEVSLVRYPRNSVIGATVAKYEGVYCDSLRAVVESMTGLRMTLGTMGARS